MAVSSYHRASMHTDRGTRISVWVDDGFGRLTRISFSGLITRIVTGWGEL